MKQLEDHIAYCATSLDKDIPWQTRAMAGMLYYERENGPGSCAKLIKTAMEYVFSDDYKPITELLNE